MSELADDKFFATPDVPDTWATPVFTDVFETISTSGKKLKQREYQSSGSIPVVDQGEALVGGYTDDESLAIEVENPLIVFGDHTRALKFLKSRFAPGADGTKVLNPNAALDPMFAFFALKATRLPDKGYSRHFSFLKKVRIPVAPLAEQKRIVEKIETLFARLDKGEEAVREVQKLLNRYRQSVLKSAVTGQLTADWRAEHTGELGDGEETLSRILDERREAWNGKGKYKPPEEPSAAPKQELPAGWGWASVDQVTSQFGNGLSRKPVLEPNEFPILRISAARPMKVSVDDLRYYAPNEGEKIDRFWVETGDLLFTRYNGSAHLVGVCGLMREEDRVLHPDKLIKARPVASPDLFSDYLELAWNCGETRKHIERNIKTTAGQQGIAGSDVKTAPFPLPSGAEQQEIAARVQEAFAKAESLEKWCETELKRSASLRQSILKDAFAGRLVPQDPTDEPASALLARIAEAKTTTKKTRRKVPA